MNESVLQIEGLSKNYGRLSAVKNLDLTINRGTVFGLLGPNGSGKTTTLGMVLGAINPTGGRYLWFGEERGAEVRRGIGAILESPAFYHYLTATQNLRIVAAIKNVVPTRIDAVLQRVGLLSRKDDKFKTFSLGMKQRLAIAAALLSDPKVMILDEPTNGLDPSGIADIRDLIIGLANEGRTIILASHLLDEVQRICTDFAVLDHGTKIYQGRVDELGSERPRVEVNAADEQALQTALRAYADVMDVRKEGSVWVATLAPGTGPAELNAHLMERGITLSHLNLRRHTLEERFLEILKNQTDQNPPSHA